MTRQNWTYVPDGRSLRPVLEGNATTWRNAILLEAGQNNVYVPKSPAYRGIRTTGTDRKYVEYEGTERELYDLGADPYELTNRYEATAPPPDLVSRLKVLETLQWSRLRGGRERTGAGHRGLISVPRGPIGPTPSSATGES